MRVNSKPYRSLARAIVIRAVLDSILLRFPGTARRELLEWFRSERRDRAPKKLAIEKWQRKQAAAIRRFFADGGTDLAKRADCYDVVEKARRPIDHNRIWVVLHRHKCKDRDVGDGKRRRHDARREG